MGFDNNFKIEIEEDEIVKLLGYKDSEPGEKVRTNIKKEIVECIKYFKPHISWRKISIKTHQVNRVILENDVVLQGKFIANKLLKCQYIIVLVATVGGDIDKVIHEAFESGDYLKGVMDDNIATSALGVITKSFWHKMLDDVKGSCIGITSRLSPGNGEWEVKEQTKIFDCLKNIKSEVNLIESYMMIPLKSTSAIYGFGEGLGITSTEHLCSECLMKDCSYKTNSKIEVKILNKGKQVSLYVNNNSNLFKVLIYIGIFVPGICGGKGHCGKCKVLVLSGIDEPTTEELKLLSVDEIHSGVRLACEINVIKAIEINIEIETHKIQIMTDWKERSFTVDPNVMKKHLIIDKPSIDDQRDDCKRIRDAVGIYNLSIGYDLLPSISSKLRNADFDITLSIYNNILLEIEVGDTTKEIYGFAVDIGTTTIACYFVDLVTGRTIDIESQENNQRSYGADVISRINYTIENEQGTSIFKKIIIGQINDMVDMLCKRNNICNKNVYNMSVVGNTIMIHFLLGLPTSNIAMGPYIAVLMDAYDITAEELGININGYISILPSIASYVGSDITGGILSSGMIETEKYSLLLDLGTNGEIAIGNCAGVVTCSTAAGPAFEGANIKCGVGSINGAICNFDLDQKQIYQTIGGIKASGICGSGVIDVVSEFLKHKIIDGTGRMLGAEEIENIDLSKRVYIEQNAKEFLIEKNSINGSAIVFTQKDVREVQLAKAAIATGIQLLIKEINIGYEDIEKVYLGGGFGNFVNIDSSIRIGMIPNELKGKIYSIGNCAGLGAKMYLLSKRDRKRSQYIIEKASYVELSNRKDFQDYYIDFMMF
mgnify:CR=1 FL=1